MKKYLFLILPVLLCCHTTLRAALETRAVLNTPCLKQYKLVVDSAPRGATVTIYANPEEQTWGKDNATVKEIFGQTPLEIDLRPRPRLCAMIESSRSPVYIDISKNGYETEQCRLYQIQDKDSGVYELSQHVVLKLTPENRRAAFIKRCADAPGEILENKRAAFIKECPFFVLDEQTKNAILKGELLIGMFKEQVIASRGEPDKKKKTINASGTHEEWVYFLSKQRWPILDCCLYFENNTLTSWEQIE